MNYTKTEDLLGTVDGPLEIDFTPYLGDWINTNPETGLAKKLSLGVRNGTLYLTAYGVGKDGLIEWGESPCIPFTDAVNSSTVLAFRTEYDFETMKIQMVSNVKRGTLVLQLYTTFKDGSPRFNYYNREFFAPAG